MSGRAGEVTREEFDIVCEMIEILVANTDAPERMSDEAQEVLLRFGHMRGHLTDADMDSLNG